MREKPDIVKFVKIAKRLFVLFSAVAIPAEMVFLVFSFLGYLGCIICAAVLGVGYIAVYIFYALKISMGTVIGMETTNQVVHVKTKRKTWTYDINRGCVRVKEHGNRYVATFETMDSRDSFVFYKRVLFSAHGAEQFTEDEIKLFYPSLGDDEDE